jgi:hypothetical protein
MAVWLSVAAIFVSGVNVGYVLRGALEQKWRE